MRETAMPACDPEADDPSAVCTGENEICCPELSLCEVPDITGACGENDPPSVLPLLVSAKS